MLKPTNNENGYKAGDRCVPVAIRRCFTDEHTVEYEVTKAKLHSAFTHTIITWWASLASESYYTHWLGSTSRVQYEKPHGPHSRNFL